MQEVTLQQLAGPIALSAYIGALAVIGFALS
jgi:hypothetical protein